jgi:DNA mismatch repair protein MLH3
VWIDPNSGTTFLVDKRTGHSNPRIPLSLESGEESAQAISSARRTIAFARPEDRVGEPPQWILDALEVGTIRADIVLKLMSANKSNSAYLVSELPIPSISQQPPNVLSLPFGRLSLTTCATHSSNCVDSSPSSIFDQPSTWSLQKDDLTRMKVINQLDRKFILCTVDPIRESDDSDQALDIPGRILVLVDQHAASERVRVEGFLKTLCHNYFDLESIEKHSGANRIELDPPRPIILSRKEASVLRGSRSGLGRWCFNLSWPESSRDQSVDQDTHEQVLVHSVPHVVGDKVRRSIRFVKALLICWLASRGR